LNTFHIDLIPNLTQIFGHSFRLVRIILDIFNDNSYSVADISQSVAPYFTDQVVLLVPVVWNFLVFDELAVFFQHGHENLTQGIRPETQVFVVDYVEQNGLDVVAGDALLSHIVPHFLKIKQQKSRCVLICVQYFEQLDRGLQRPFVVHQQSLLLLEGQAPVALDWLIIWRFGLLRHYEKLRLKTQIAVNLHPQVTPKPWSTEKGCCETR
jgi:hypothetical protein